MAKGKGLDEFGYPIDPVERRKYFERFTPANRDSERRSLEEIAGKTYDHAVRKHGQDMISSSTYGSSSIPLTTTRINKRSKAESALVRKDPEAEELKFNANNWMARMIGGFSLGAYSYISLATQYSPIISDLFGYETPWLDTMIDPVKGSLDAIGNAGLAGLAGMGVMLVGTYFADAVIKKFEKRDTDKKSQPFKRSHAGKAIQTIMALGLTYSFIAGMPQAMHESIMKAEAGAPSIGMVEKYVDVKPAENLYSMSDEEFEDKYGKIFEDSTVEELLEGSYSTPVYDASSDDSSKESQKSPAAEPTKKPKKNKTPKPTIEPTLAPTAKPTSIVEKDLEEVVEKAQPTKKPKKDKSSSGQKYSGLAKKYIAELETNPYARAAIAQIVHYEGGDFNIMFGGQRFDSYKDHPRTCVPFWGGCSDAAGIGQFMSFTWDSVAKTLGLKDFSPKNQLIAMMYLLDQKRGVLDELSEGNMRDALPAISCEWASFPPDYCGYGQYRVKTGSMEGDVDMFVKEYKNHYLPSAKKHKDVVSKTFGFK